MTTKLFSIFISSFILVQSFNIHIGDVLKLNELVEHAEFHKNKYGDGFLIYISKHYGDLKQAHKKQHQEEEKKHSHTPINHDCSSQLQVSFLLIKNSFTIEIPQLVEKSTNFYYQDRFSAFEKQRIFQPPKHA